MLILFSKGYLGFLQLLAENSQNLAHTFPMYTLYNKIYTKATQSTLYFIPLVFAIHYFRQYYIFVHPGIEKMLEQG